MKLTKGLEEEVFTGYATGEVVGLSDQVKAAMPGYHTEPDKRNAEFATEPHRDYEELKAEFMGYRLQLRDFIATLGDYTLIPGGALSLGDSNEFHLTDPGNAYYVWIRNAYGTNVVTASTHISIGVDAPEDILRVFRVIRCEASLYLAMTAASPWLDGKATGYHSTRWKIFPQTPSYVPLFTSYPEYVAWMKSKLASGEMQNQRHLWLGARPNGQAAPHDLNRVELRICDRISHPETLLGMTALLEARVHQILHDPSIEPLDSGPLGESDLISLCNDNEDAVSRASTDATVFRWSDGARMPVGSWVARMLEEVYPYAVRGGFDPYLGGVTRILDLGSIAKRWLAWQRAGRSIQDILQEAIQDAEQCDRRCQPAACRQCLG